MYGCNNFCTYCIVPYVRGRERSRTPSDILKEIEALSNEGYKEITLLGQNVNSYDGGNGYRFSDLLRDVNKIEGIEKIRFVSPHPKDFKDDVIDAICECEKVSKIIHLPLQSGSSNVLKVMNRKYTKEQYLELVDKMKAKIPNVLFSTDIIVGFPGETENDFEDTLDVVKKVNFEQVFMFIYSRRVGTPADKMENQVPEEIKHKRFDRLKELVESQIAENNKKYIGTVQKVLVEGKSKNNENMLTGRTDSNKVVVFEGKDDLINNVVDVKIVSEHMWYLKGEI
jgi:tRNA-2-methylthio-N6-dimethylallyladenosine synthase